MSMRKVKEIIKGYNNVEVVPVEKVNELVLVFTKEPSQDVAEEIASKINNANIKAYWDGMVIKGKGEQLWYGLLDKVPNTDILYPL